MRESALVKLSLPAVFWILMFIVTIPTFAEAYNCWSVSKNSIPSANIASIVAPTGVGYNTVGNTTYVTRATGAECAALTTLPPGSAGTYADFNVQAPMGSALVSVKVDSVQVGTTPGVYRVVKGTKASHTIVASYSAVKYTITTSSVGGGYISPTLTVTGGDVDIQVIPSQGYELASVTIDNITHTNGETFDSVSANQKYTFPNVNANHSVTASFRVIPYVTAYIRSANQTIQVGDTVLVDGSGSSSNVVPTYSWSVSPATGATLIISGDTKTATFSSTVIGTYTVTLTLTGPEAAPSVSSSTFNVITASKYGSIGCISCHKSRDPELVTLYENSPHYSTTAADVSCRACHVPIGNESHPFLPAAALTSCSGCHTTFPSDAPHTEYIGTNLCTGCHNPHSIVASCDTCHDSPPATASHLKHYGSADGARYGDTRSTGAFGNFSSGYVFGCGNCHPLDGSKHKNGTVEVELYNATASAGSLKALNPATAAYVPGAEQLTDSKGKFYSNGTCSNVYCHSSRSWTTPTGVPNYAPSCTPEPPADLLITTNYATVTWGGTPLGCAGCHGSPPRTRAPANAAAAGDSHSWIVNNGYGPIEYMHSSNMMPNDWDYPWPDPISCMYCHNDTVRQLNTYYYDSTDPAWPVVQNDVPIANHAKHVNGTNDVAFERNVAVPSIEDAWTGVSWKNQRLSNAAYDPPTKTCSNVACHLLRTNVKWGTPYKALDSQNDCARCHEQGDSCPDRDAALTRQPSISSNPVTVLAAPGYQYRYAVSASEPGSGALTYSLSVAPEGMTISTAGLISWTPVEAQLGLQAPVKIVVGSVASGGVLIAVQEFTVTVTPPQPSITSTPITATTAWKIYSYDVNASVPSGMAAATYSLTSSPTGMTINASGVISWTPTDTQTGSFPVTVTATSGGNTVSQSFTLQVDPSPITFSFAPVTTGATQVAYSYTATATKAGGGTITYSISGRPAWMTFNTATGAMTGTPSATQNATSNITITASSGGYVGKQIFSLVISPSPITFTSTPVLTAKVGVPYTYTVIPTMAGGGTYTYTFVTRPTTAMTVTSSGDPVGTTGVINWTPTVTYAGNKSVIIRVRNGNSSADHSFTIVVSP